MADRNNPVFLVGVARSGTSLLSLILDSHSRLAIPYESHFIEEYYQELNLFGDLTDEANRRRLIRSILSEPFVAHWDQPIQVEDIQLDTCTS